jgi:putative membrane protein
MLVGVIAATEFSLLPLLFGLVSGEVDKWTLIAASVFAPVVFYKIIKYWFLRFRVTPTRIEMREGLLFRRERSLERAAVGSVERSQGIVQRLVGLVDLRMENTSGAGGTEVMIPGISILSAERLRRQILESVAANRIEVPAQDTPELSLHPAQIALWSITNAKFGVIGIAGLFGLEGGEFVSEIRETGGWWLQNVPGGWLSALVTILLLVALASVVWGFLRLYNFQLQRIGGTLHLRFGLVPAVRVAIDVRKIRKITVVTSLMDRALGITSARCEIAGFDGNDKDTGRGLRLAQRHMIPLVKRRHVEQLLQQIDSKLVLPKTWQPLSSHALRRILGKRIRLATILSAPWLWLSPTATLISVGILAPLLLLHGVLDYRLSGYFVDGDSVAWRQGVFLQRISLVPTGSVELCTVRQSPIDRLWGRGTLVVDTAGAGAAGHNVRIPYLTVGHASRLALQLCSPVRA